MTGCLANACSILTRSTQQSAALVLTLSALSLAVGCNGFLPGGTSGQGNSTEFSRTDGCATAYFDNEFNYGFDLPADAELIRTKNESNSLTNSLWTITESGALINIITRVQAASQHASLATVVSFANDLSVSAGADLISEEEVTLSNGGEGFQIIIRFDGLTAFRVQALSDARLFHVEAVVEESARTADMDAVLSEIVLSLCIE
jgi:hypothetical protein